MATHNPSAPAVSHASCAHRHRRGQARHNSLAPSSAIVVHRSGSRSTISPTRPASSKRSMTTSCTGDRGDRTASFWAACGLDSRHGQPGHPHRRRATRHRGLSGPRAHRRQPTWNHNLRHPCGVGIARWKQRDERTETRPDTDITWAALNALVLPLGTIILRGHIERHLPERFSSPAQLGRWQESVNMLLHDGLFRHTSD